MPALRLDGRSAAQTLRESLATKITNFSRPKFLAILFFGENSSSATYVHHKQKFGAQLGLPALVFGQPNFLQKLPENPNENFDEILARHADFLDRELSLDDIFQLLKNLNTNPDCRGILVQLPLPDSLRPHQREILDAVSLDRDIDALHSTKRTNFLGATPRAVITLLSHHQLLPQPGTSVAVIGQSDLVGAPLADFFVRRGCTVFSANSTTKNLREITKSTDFLISCTGQIELIDETFLRPSHDQILIDVGFGHRDGRPLGDLDQTKIQNSCQAFSPVPGGVGPLTIASLFANALDQNF